MSKKAIIVSGGGAKGAWGVGVVKALDETGNKYQRFPDEPYLGEGIQCEAGCSMNRNWVSVFTVKTTE